jgi:hypothetical protein
MKNDILIPIGDTVYALRFTYSPAEAQAFCQSHPAGYMVDLHRYTLTVATHGTAEQVAQRAAEATAAASDFETHGTAPRSRLLGHDQPRKSRQRRTGPMIAITAA